MKNLLIIVALVALATVVWWQMQPTSNQTASTASSETPAPEASPALSSLISSAAPGARVFFIEPQSGAVLSSPITVKFGIENMTVAPAGTDIPNSGHHHLLINLQEMPDLSQPLPASEQVIHFGKGQTETMLELEPGQHTLQLLLGNYLHIPHEQPVMSEPIEITVE